MPAASDGVIVISRTSLLYDQTIVVYLMLVFLIIEFNMNSMLPN